jgi:transposase
MITRRREGWTVGMIAAAYDVSDATVHKWLRRCAQGGKAGLMDRGSRPHRLRRPVPQDRVYEIIALREQRRTGWQIAQRLYVETSGGSGITASSISVDGKVVRTGNSRT